MQESPFQALIVSNSNAERFIAMDDRCTLARDVWFISHRLIDGRKCGYRSKGNAMIQAEIGGAARIDTGIGMQRPGFMLRDFALTSSDGEEVRLSSFRGRSNLVVVFPGYSKDVHAFLAELVRNGHNFSHHDTTVLLVVPYGPGRQGIPIPTNSSVIILHDEKHLVYRLSGAMDENGCLVPLAYLTDRFGEIVSAYGAPDQLTPPRVTDILNTLDFVNQQCPECEPPEWPR